MHALIAVCLTLFCCSICIAMRFDAAAADARRGRAETDEAEAGAEAGAEAAAAALDA